MKYSRPIRKFIPVDIYDDSLLFINYLNALHLNNNTFGCEQFKYLFQIFNALEKYNDKYLCYADCRLISYFSYFHWRTI